MNLQVCAFHCTIKWLSNLQNLPEYSLLADVSDLIGKETFPHSESKGVN